MPMRRIRTNLLAAVPLLLAFALPVAAQDTPTPLALGAAPPMADVKMKNVDGRELSIAEVRGTRGTLVVFACNHCPWVKAWEARIVALGNQYSKRGVGVIAVNSNDPAAFPEDDFATMQARAKERGMAYAYVVDATSEVARAFGASHTPEAFLFDRSGKLVYHGAIDDNAREPGKVKSRYLEDALKSVVAGKPVRLAEAKALGCSIKYRAKA
jgi:peroxiredoxin